MVVASIIGAGRMGTWFATFLKKNGYKVTIYDTDSSAAKKLASRRGLEISSNLQEAMVSGDVVILATPTNVTKRILELEGPKVARGTLLVEISSIKEPVKKIIVKLKRHGNAILSIHPMFGPGVRTLAKKVIFTVAVPRPNLHARRLLSLFEKRGIRIVPTDLDSHDKLVSMTLTLPYFVNIAFLNALRKMVVDANKLREIAGTTFKMQLLTAEAVCHDAPANSKSILINSDWSRRATRVFAREANRFLEHVERAESQGVLREIMHANTFARKDSMFKDAYRMFHTALEAVNL